MTNKRLNMKDPYVGLFFVNLNRKSMSLYIYTRSRLFCAAALKAKAGDERINVIETKQTGQ